MDFQHCPTCEAMNPPDVKQCQSCKAYLPDVPDFAPAARSVEPPPEPEPEPAVDAEPHPPVDAGPKPVAAAEPQPPVDAGPKPVATTEPHPPGAPSPKPVAAEPQPRPPVAPSPKPVAAAEPQPSVVPSPKPVAAAEPQPPVAPSPKPVTVAEPQPPVPASPKPMAAAEPHPPGAGSKPVAAAEPHPPVASPKPVAAVEPHPPVAASPRPIATAESHPPVAPSPKPAATAEPQPPVAAEPHPPAAVAAAGTALEEPPPFEAAPEVLARVAHIQGEIAKRPSANALYLQLCQVYVDGNRVDLAIRALETCLQHDPKNVYLRHRLSLLTGTITGTTPAAAPPHPVAASVPVRPSAGPGARPASAFPARPKERRLWPLAVGALALLAVGIAGKLVFFPDTKLLVTGTFSALAPKWSPTGRQFAFLMQEANATRLGVYDVRKGSHRALATVRAWDATAYAWSPDGKRIAFDGIEGEWEEAVFVVDVEGGQPRRIANGSSPSWSTDGRSLVLWCAGERPHFEGMEGTSLAFGGTPPGPCRVDVDGGQVTRSAASADVFTGAGLAVSPVLGKVVYDRVTGAPAETTAGAPDKELQDLADSVAARGARNVAEGSRDLARELEARQYLRRHQAGGVPAYQSDVFVADVDGGQPTQLTTDGRSAFPTWAPDGTSILYTDTVTGELWMMKADGSDRQAVVKSPLRVTDPGAVALTADGRTVVFAAPVEANEAVAKIMTGEAPADLHAARVGSSSAKRLANRHPFKQRFALSPDGKSIVYEVLAETGTLTEAKTRTELWLMSR